MISSPSGVRRAPWTFTVGLLVIAGYALVALLAPVLAPFGEREIIGGMYEPWSARFPLGTDAVGRDMLTRLIYGARNTVGVAFLTTCLAFLAGGLGGLLAATLGGWVDQVLSRIVDVLMAIPSLIFILLVLSFLGTSMPVLVVVVALFESTRVYRIARAVGVSVEVMEFVEVAKVRGEHGKFVLIFVADSRHAIMVRLLSLGSLRGLGNGFGRPCAAV